MGQMDRPTTEEEELIYKLYYKFFSMAMPKAKFLLPINSTSGFPEPSQESNAHVLEESATFNLPTREGKMDEIRFQCLLIGNVCEWFSMKIGAL